MNSSPPMTAEIERGWTEYHQYIENTRTRLLQRPEMADPNMRAMANYAISSLVAGGFQFYVAPRQDYPVFYRDAIWSPFIPWGGPASDMVYRWCFLDGRCTYRITGRRGSVLFTDFHLFEGYIGTESMRDLGNYDLDKFEMDAEGRFEIIASAEKADGNWMKLDPAVRNIAIQMRETWWDWESEAPAQLHIERIDDGPRTMLFSEDEFLQRLHLAGRCVEQFILRSLGYGKMVRRMAGGENLFSMVVGEQSDARDYGASPRAGYACAYWDLKPGEALIIDSVVPEAKYWSLQLTTPFWDTLDFSYHQSGLNGRQMKIDADNHFRCVLSFEDPGIANWLDPIGLPQGQCMFRYYDGKPFETPTAKVVKFSELKTHLPAETISITPEQRAEAMCKRARASLRRWGY